MPYSSHPKKGKGRAKGKGKGGDGTEHTEERVGGNKRKKV